MLGEVCGNREVLGDDEVWTTSPTREDSEEGDKAISGRASQPPVVEGRLVLLLLPGPSGSLWNWPEGDARDRLGEEWLL